MNVDMLDVSRQFMSSELFLSLFSKIRNVFSIFDVKRVNTLGHKIGQAQMKET